MDKKRRKVKIEEQNQINSAMDDHETPVLEPDLTRDIFKQIWTRKAQEREGIDFHQTDAMDSEVVAGTSKKIRPTFEAVQRAATVAEGEGGAKVEAIHLERILPQLLLDF